MSLYPVFETPTVVEDQAAQPEFKQSLCIDQATGDLLIDGSGKPVLANGHDTWIQWCVKALATERYAMLSYSGEFGVEFVSAMEQPARDAQEAALARTIKEALMADPAKRTGDVRSFAFSWSDDSVVITFEVIGSDGYTGSITVTA